ncbi:YopX family protein [Elizabethkingia meningoseptica]|uniref:YopX family protein n=1 Tax=Elizabethkingia meningoseptica TaxID=238 RepID=UPI003159319A
MREIIFRGKRVDNGEWLYGDLCRVNEQVLIQSEWEYPNQWDDVDMNVIPETVGQFTGLLDCKGNRIFEGDILKINTAVCVGDFFENGYEEDVPQEITCEVVYRTKNASFDLDILESDTHLTGWGFYDGEGYTMEMISNIHESLTPNK